MLRKNKLVTLAMPMLLILLVTGIFTGLILGANIPSTAWSRDVNAGGYLDGAPIGGFGAGTITWRFDGNFYKGRLNLSSNDLTTDSNCVFSIYQKPSGQSATTKKLNSAGLGSGQATYYSLFPKAWVDYSGSQFTCKVKVTQFSPIIPGDYQRSSYPVGVYKWEITNPTASACDVAVMLTWNNNFSGSSAETVSAGNNIGLKLKRSGTGNATDENQGEFTLAATQVAGTTVTYASTASVSNLDTDFSTDGLLNNAVGANAIGGLSFKASVGAGQTITIPVVLAWDIPIAQAGTGNKWYREYTRFFGRSGLNSWNIATEALNNYATWESSIDNWQNQVLNNSNYPNWLKTTLFNELYYCFTGGTYWEAGAASGQDDDPNEDMFSHLECYDYPYYGTSDVRFYGSWPLILLWPEIDKQCVRQFCDSVYNTRADRPAGLGTCAHDFGDPNSIFTQWNAYGNVCNNWKDLNSKLVLTVYRDWNLTGKVDSAFLSYCWIPVQTAMDKVKSQDSDGDGLPNSNGIDQTYDQMSLYGNTAYCGSLFLAACRAAKEIALALGDTTKANTYQSWFDLAQQNFQTKLWNGTYYKIDDGSSNPSRIMSDQLCGQWYAKACGLAGIVPDTNANAAFTKVYDYNFKKFDTGQHGVVNVMLPGGTVDNSNMFGPEVWIGTTWSVVAAMIQEGLMTQADEIGNSMYTTIYRDHQQWFRTPEAWLTGVTGVRANYYMRANCVWSVKRAYDIHYNIPTWTPAPTNTPRPTSTPVPTPGVNLALNKTVTASSVEKAGVEAVYAVDGNASTRWASAYSDPQWIYVDLGGSYPVNRVILRWEAAYGQSYKIQVSNDASNWTDVYSTTTGNGGNDDLSFTATSARYVRMYGTVRGTSYGYSLWEFEVYGTGGSTPAPTATPSPTPTPTPTPTAVPGRYEAENAALSGGVAVNTNHTGYSGTGFVDGYWNSGATTTFTVNAGSAGTYNVDLRYSNAMGSNETLSIYVNGTKLRQVSLSNLANWDTWSDKIDALTLNAGSNTIAYKYDTGDTGNVNLDYISLTSTATATPTPTPTPGSTATPTPVPYTQNFNDGSIGGWARVIGSGAVAVESYSLSVDGQNSSTVVVDNNSPSRADGVLEFKVTPQGANGRFQAIFRYSSTTSWAGIGYDVGTIWCWDNGAGQNGTFTGPTLNGGTTYTIKVRYVGSTITLWLDGTQIYSGTITQLPTSAGKIGVRSWSTGHNHCDDFVYATP
jgi:non-lysosomal glucosylceramidase